MIKKASLFLLVICFYSCEELIEVEDISEEAVTILAPSDNITLSSTVVNFSWESIAFAEEYRLQIAFPNFETAQEIIEDTIIITTGYTKNLLDGNYQWRIKAINFGYQTQYSTQNLTIEN